MRKYLNVFANASEFYRVHLMFTALASNIRELAMVHRNYSDWKSRKLALFYNAMKMTLLSVSNNSL